MYLGRKLGRKCREGAEKVFNIISDDFFIKTHQIANRTELSQRAVENAIARLKKEGFLKRVGPDRGGHWEVLK
ncbi:MAG: HTH domain-containing protein [Candidatus Omnitrophota bacterium]